jgi:hypothetical protein
MTICRLRVGRAELKQRFLGRGGRADSLPEVLSEADAMDTSDFADVCVDTSGLQVTDATRLVRERAPCASTPTGLASKRPPM